MDRKTKWRAIYIFAVQVLVVPNLTFIQHVSMRGDRQTSRARRETNGSTGPRRHGGSDRPTGHREIKGIVSRICGQQDQAMVIRGQDYPEPLQTFGKPFSSGLPNSSWANLRIPLWRLESEGTDTMKETPDVLFSFGTVSDGFR